jgi:hypothetical protein
MAGEQDLDHGQESGVTLGAELEIPAGESEVKVAVIGGAREKFGGGGGQSLTAGGELLGALAIGEEAVIADALKALRKGVQQEAADELIGVEGHDLGPLWMTVVLPAEGNLIILEA